MQLKEWVPPAVKEYLKLLRVKTKYPGRIIDSPFISPRVILGQGCQIGRNAEISEGVSVGDYTYVGAGTIIRSGQIGRFCSVAYSCQIGLAEHPANFLSTSPFTYGTQNLLGLDPLWEDYPAPPIIENDVWIGSNAIILQGVKINNGAIVAAGAVVTKDVPPYAVVAGVPAKVIKYRFEDETIELLLRLCWWELPPKELMKLKDLFARGADFEYGLK